MSDGNFAFNKTNSYFQTLFYDNTHWINIKFAVSFISSYLTSLLFLLNKLFYRVLPYLQVQKYK